MDGGGALPAAVGAAMLGSRNGRRQARAALGYAAEFGAYSVGFALVRGALAGFTVYFDGRHAGSPTQRTFMPMAAVSARVPMQDRGRPDNGRAQPSARDAAPRQQQRRQGRQQQHEQPSSGAACDGLASACGAVHAPTAARRMRGCRGGRKRRTQDGKGGHSSAAAPASTCNCSGDGSSIAACSCCSGCGWQ